MFCSNCGTRLNDTDRFCKMCGTAVPVPSAVAPEGPKAVPPEQAGGKGLRRACFITGIVANVFNLLLMVPIGVIAFVLVVVGLFAIIFGAGGDVLLLTVGLFAVTFFGLGGSIAALALNGIANSRKTGGVRTKMVFRRISCIVTAVITAPSALAIYLFNQDHDEFAGFYIFLALGIIASIVFIVLTILTNSSDRKALEQQVS